MTRSKFQSGDLTLSYLDSTDPLPAIIALHAHWMEALTFAPFAEVVSSQWRVIALDQRGHGHSDHATSYSREDYLGDLEALFAHLDLEDAILLGNSLGGVNAYQFAARRPQRVRAMVIEDIGVDVPGDLPPMTNWGGTFTTREQLETRVGPRMFPYLKDSIRQTRHGWMLAFRPDDMIKSQASLEGNHWPDWLASQCPALIIRGSESRVTTPEHVAEMAQRRPQTKLCTLKGGHVVHQDNLAGFSEAVMSFLTA